MTYICITVAEVNLTQSPRRGASLDWMLAGLNHLTLAVPTGTEVAGGAATGPHRVCRCRRQHWQAVAAVTLPSVSYKSVASPCKRHLVTDWVVEF